jgi:hypothetical protein
MLATMLLCDGSTFGTKPSLDLVRTTSDGCSLEPVARLSGWLCNARPDVLVATSEISARVYRAPVRCER